MLYNVIYICHYMRHCSLPESIHCQSRVCQFTVCLKDRQIDTFLMFWTTTLSFSFYPNLQIPPSSPTETPNLFFCVPTVDSNRNMKLTSNWCVCFFSFYFRHWDKNKAKQHFCPKKQNYQETRNPALSPDIYFLLKRTR